MSEPLAAEPGIGAKIAQRQIFQALIDFNLVDANGLPSPLAQNLLCPLLPIWRTHADPQDETVCNRITLELLGLLAFEEADDHRCADPAGRSDAYGDNGRPYPGATRRKKGSAATVAPM